MKKLVLFVITAVAFVSCGKNKKETVAEAPKAEAVSLEIDGTYIKDDSLEVFYQVAGNIQYENPVTKVIKGSPLPQKIIFDMPEGLAVESFAIHPSLKKDQEYITITNITVKVGKEVIDGNNYKYADYFMPDESFKWDVENSRYILTHTNKYAPAFTGKEALKDLMVK